MCVCVCVYMYVYIYIYIYTHIHVNVIPRVQEGDRISWKHAGATTKPTCYDLASIQAIFLFCPDGMPCVVHPVCLVQTVKS